jgi:hypothetical protein
LSQPATDEPGYRSALDRLLDGDGADHLPPSDDDGDDEEGDGVERSRLKVLSDLLLVGLLLLVIALSVVLLVRGGEEQAERAADSGASTDRVDVIRPPAEAPPSGTYVETRVTKKGDVQVRQWIRSASPLFGVLISIPPLPGGPGKLTATDVVVSADEAVLNQPDTVDARGNKVFFAAPPELVHVRYTLRGVVQESTSVPGRAFLRTTALNVAHSPQSGPTRVTVLGDVLSLACVATPLAAPRPCGEPSKGRWTVLLKGPARNNVVTAQINLP